jgi:hypothetical protein
VDELCLIFSKACAGVVVDPEDLDEYDCTEKTETRAALFKLLFESMKKRQEQPNTSKIRHLTIQNLQNMPLPAFTSSELFRSVTQHLDHLDLQVAEESTHYGPAVDINCIERVKFEPYMQRAWLAPLSAQLTSLALSFNEYWGTMPGTFTGHGLVFPHLKTLKIGRYSVSHYDHLDWVLAQPSLRTLILDDCRVVCHVWAIALDIQNWRVSTRDWIRIPPETFQFDDSDENVLYHFPGTWESMFDKIRVSLPHLVDFRFQIDWGRRYVAFRDGMDYQTWTWSRENGDMAFGDVAGSESERPKLNRSEETDRGDSRALEALRKTISGRMQDVV